MRDYPQCVGIDGSQYAFERILKDDFFSVNVLYRASSGRRMVLKLSDFRFALGVILRPFAIFMSGHEYKIYSAVKDLPGVPALGPRFGRRGYFHEYAEGIPLSQVHEGRPLPVGFFDSLRDIIDTIHARGIIYLDSNKKGNIIVGDDDRPYLIDYQICIDFGHRNGLLGAWKRRLFNALRREDIYHVYKHKRLFQGGRLTDLERKLAERTGLNAGMARFIGDPYRRMKRLIYPKGSNDTAWYLWKRKRDRVTSND